MAFCSCLRTRAATTIMSTKATRTTFVFLKAWIWAAPFHLQTCHSSAAPRCLQVSEDFCASRDLPRHLRPLRSNGSRPRLRRPRRHPPLVSPPLSRIISITSWWLRYWLRQLRTRIKTSMKVNWNNALDLLLSMPLCYREILSLRTDGDERKSNGAHSRCRRRR